MTFEFTAPHTALFAYRLGRMHREMLDRYHDHGGCVASGSPYVRRLAGYVTRLWAMSREDSTWLNQAYRLGWTHMDRR